MAPRFTEHKVQLKFGFYVVTEHFDRQHHTDLPDLPKVVPPPEARASGATAGARRPRNRHVNGFARDMAEFMPESDSFAQDVQRSTESRTTYPCSTASHATYLDSSPCQRPRV